MDMQNYYEILGVPRKAMQLAIETAYENFKGQYESEVKTPEEWQLIREAYQILGDPEHRMLYDEVLKQNDPKPEPIEPKSTTPAWLVEYRRKQAAGETKQPNPPIQRASSPPVRSVPERVPARHTSPPQSNKTLEAPAGRPIQHAKARYQLEDKRKYEWSALKFGISLAAAVTVIILRVITSSQSDAKTNEQTSFFKTREVAQITALATYSSSSSLFGQTTPRVTRIPRATRTESPFTSTPYPTVVRSPDSTTPEPTPTRTATPLPTTTSTPTLTRTPRPPTQIRQRCQVTNTSGKQVTIYENMALDSAKAGFLRVNKSLIVYRETGDAEWMQIADERAGTEYEEIMGAYLWAEDVEVNFCINSN